MLQCSRRPEMLQCRHHHAYVRKLKEALKKAPELAEMDLNKLMQAVGTVSIWHPEVDQDVRNHGGGASYIRTSGFNLLSYVTLCKRWDRSSSAHAGSELYWRVAFRQSTFELPARGPQQLLQGKGRASTWHHDAR